MPRASFCKTSLTLSGLARPPQYSRLQLIAFSTLEDELFVAPERTEYEERVTLELLPGPIHEYRLRNHLTQDQLGERLGVQKSQISYCQNRFLSYLWQCYYYNYFE